MEITFIGTGGAFDDSNSSAIVSNGSEGIAIDAGDSFLRDLRTQNISLDSVDRVLLTHLHGDHFYGLEKIGFYRKIRKLDPLKLYSGSSRIVENAWRALSVSMGVFDDADREFDYYFEDCCNDYGDYITPFKGLIIDPFLNNHVGESYGYILNEKTMYSGDTKICEDLDVYRRMDLIFHDCNLYDGSVHAYYGDLVQLPDDIKSKMWLYHFTPDKDVRTDGFAGAVRKGTTFQI